jgi:predicted phosphodiesterase
MRLLILSDLHHELWKEFAPRIDVSVSQPDVVVLAGDIDVGAKAVEWAAKQFEGIPVLYVHGNHEAYGKNLEDMHAEIQSACSAASNVHFLNTADFILNDVRFLGATLWTDFRLLGDDERQVSMFACENGMNDYKRIRLRNKDYRKLRAADTAQFHSIQKGWLRKKLDEEFQGKTVVVTHMAPTIQSISPEYCRDPVSAAYASRLDDLVAKADLWIHGHTHESSDYRIEKCRVVSNPCGYKNKSGDPENQRFNANFVVEI